MLFQAWFCHILKQEDPKAEIIQKKCVYFKTKHLDSMQVIKKGVGGGGITKNLA